MRAPEIRQFSGYYAQSPAATPELGRFCRRVASPKSLLLVLGTVAALVYVASVTTHRTAHAKSDRPTVCRSANS